MAISMGRISNNSVRRFTRTLLSMQNMFYHQELKDEPLIVRDKLTKPLFRKQGELIRILLTHWILKFLSICIEFNLPIEPLIQFLEPCWKFYKLVVVTRRRLSHELSMILNKEFHKILKSIDFPLILIDLLHSHKFLIRGNSWFSWQVEGLWVESYRREKRSFVL